MEHKNGKFFKQLVKRFEEAKTEIFTEIFMDSLKSRDWEIRREIAEILSKYNDDGLVLRENIQKRLLKLVVEYLTTLKILKKQSKILKLK
jgi:DNA repair exonuclease SbcCD nuclease subunit